MATKNTKPAEYGGDQIQILEGLEAVRRRPGMYIGGTHSKGLTHIVKEIVDNAVDEALAGHCSEISIRLSEDGVVEVTDDGRGIPIEKNSKTGEPAVFAVFEILHAGGKFGGGGYTASGGLHGVGASVTNAMSAWLEVEVTRDGKVHQAKWKDSKRAQALKVIGKAPKGATGTTVRWKYDDKLFDKNAKYDTVELEETMQQKAYLVPGLKIVFARDGHPTRTYQSKAGIAEMVDTLAAEREPLPGVKTIFFSTGSDGITVPLPSGESDATLEVDVALLWTKKPGDKLYSFANIIPTFDHGTHVTGLKAALTKAMNRFGEEQGKLKKERFENSDIFSALTGAVLVKLGEPQFESQTKGRLNNAEARTAVQTFVYAQFTDWLTDKKNAKAAKEILERCLHAMKVRMAQGKISKNYDPNSIFADSGQSEKLADCNPNSDPSERELFIVEGDSAGGTAREARDSYFQAILPLRGKPLNVVSASNEKIFDNAEIKALITALGGRIDQIDGERIVILDPQKRRYSRIILTADADADGAHINAILIGVIAELMPELIHEGRLFMARPPLYRIKLDKKGDKQLYAYSDQERADIIAKYKLGEGSTTRFKGLGEMNAEQLEETVMSPKTRQLYQLRAEDLHVFDQTIALILGDTAGAAARRKEFMADEAYELLEAATAGMIAEDEA